MVLMFSATRSVWLVLFSALCHLMHSNTPTGSFPPRSSQH